MATVNQSHDPALSVREKSSQRSARDAPPHLLRCLVLTADPRRCRLLRAAAETCAWEAIVCRDAGDFLRAAFKRAVPLMLVDLPASSAEIYESIREVTEQARQTNSGLLAVCGSSGGAEETWVRCLGAWVYLSEVDRMDQLRLLFEDARTAIARRDVPRQPQPQEVKQHPDEAGWQSRESESFPLFDTGSRGAQAD